MTWKDLAGKKEDRAKLIEDSASIENFNELAGELEEFLKDRLNVLGKCQLWNTYIVWKLFFLNITNNYPNGNADHMEQNPAKDIAQQMRQQQNLEREVESIKDKMEALGEMAKVSISRYRSILKFAFVCVDWLVNGSVGIDDHN